MTIFILKLIACFSMVLDHIKYAIPETKNFLTVYAGRIAFPLFAFVITEGYVHTKDLKKYYKRLLIFAIISQIPFMLFRKELVGDYKMLNIMFTLLLGIISITVYDKIEKKYLSIPFVLITILLGDLLRVDYGSYGVTLIFIMYLFKNKKIHLTISVGFLILLNYLLNGYIAFLGSQVIFYLIFNYIAPIICILFYNGKLGKKAKYLFYWFYPIHMLILCFISSAI